MSLTFLFCLSSSCSWFSTISFLCAASFCSRSQSVWSASTFDSWTAVRPDFQPSCAMNAIPAKLVDGDCRA